jgi:hypothetical protein
MLALNINLDEFLILEFKIIYDQLYSHVTTENELYDIKSMCNQDTIICVGGADSNNTLLLVSCGSCKGKVFRNYLTLCPQKRRWFWLIKVF